MAQPLGFIHHQLPNHVCKLNNSLYGLCQASRAWFSRLTNKLQAIGFISSKTNHSLYVYYYGSITIYLLIYVDGIILTNSNVHSISSVILLLQKNLLSKIQVYQVSSQALKPYKRIITCFYLNNIIYWIFFSATKQTRQSRALP